MFVSTTISLERMAGFSHVVIVLHINASIPTRYQYSFEKNAVLQEQNEERPFAAHLLLHAVTCAVD